MSWSRLALQLFTRSLARPHLGAALVRVAWRFRARGWYTRFPYLPLPDQTYVHWRMYTAYGDYDAKPSVADVERYALWATED